ncbi:NAD(P)/FAD-dependent oxidoreductase [Deefgea piscis]|uniref:NAD(P)/FAD-dependent oxidoreductase n=1 Tax=Deefgea piscis TaxID=2739061 RepID=UPI001C7EC14A|nr:FAD-binding oxidoreductase [Deefgea piscis]QZA81702.1 FAD-binding oxidoreductase [Deefgea piscis]
MQKISHAASYYAASAHPQPARPELNRDLDVDICIIGAGFTGLSAGLFLAEAGYNVVILEQAQIAWGASGRNGGQIVNSYSRDMDVIERQYGKATADALGAMAFTGNQIIRQRIAHYQIDCDLKNGGLFAALSNKQLGHLAAQKALWERYGHTQLEMLDQAAIGQAVASERYVGGLVDHSAGHIHPLNLALGEAAAFESLGGQIFEQSAVTQIQRGTRPVVQTAQGSVRCQFVIVACNAYLGDLVPELSAKTMPCGSQVVATEPLGALAEQLIPSNYCVEDCNFLLDYYRLSADRRLIYGGGVTYGARDLAHIEAVIVPNLRQTFPQLSHIQIDYAWTGNFSLTLSRLPQMGRLGSNLYYSQGCSGHGVTYTHLAGRLLAQAIQGHNSQFDAFAKLPHHPFPGGRLLRVPLTALGAWYYALRDQLGI